MDNEEEIEVTLLDGPPVGLRSYHIRPDTPELRGTVDAIRLWSKLSDLADFALERHGYGNSDGGFGITYPSDLDEYDLAERGGGIPEGSVEVYEFFGPPDGNEFHIPETTYLSVLARVLEANGLAEEARRIDEFRSNLSGRRQRRQ